MSEKLRIIVHTSSRINESCLKVPKDRVFAFDDIEYIIARDILLVSISVAYVLSIKNISRSMYSTCHELS